MRKYIIGICLLHLAMSTVAQTSGLKAFSLREAVDYAIKNNIATKNALLSEQAAKARNNEVISLGLPQVSANFDYTYYYKQPTSPALAKIFGDPNSTSNRINAQVAKNDTTNAIQDIIDKSRSADSFKSTSFVLPHNMNVGIQLQQLIFDGRYIVGIKATKDLTLAAKLSSKLSEQDIRYNTIKAYIETQSLKETKRVIQDNLDVILKLLHDTRETYKEGLIEELDVNRLELAETNLRSQINSLDNYYNVGMASLKFNMGMPITDAIALTDNIDVLRKEVIKDVPTSFNPSQRIEAQLLETSVKLHTFDMQQKRSGNFPSIYGFANYGGGSQVSDFGDFFKKQSITFYNSTTTKYDVTRQFSNWFQSGQLGLSIKIPIIDGGARIAQTKQAKIEIEKTKNDLEQFKNAATLQVEAAKMTFLSNLIEEENTTRSIALNQKVFDKTSIKFKEGLGSSFEMISAQQQLTQNQISHITAIKNVLTSKFDLDKALGKQ
jgi:outer membrane protein